MARCPECGALVAADGGHDCPVLRATRVDSPAGRSGPQPGPKAPSARVTAQLAADADRDDAEDEAPVAALLPPAQLHEAAAAVRAAEDDDFDPRIGTLLGDHYRILERLGSGGMGTVYLVVHVHLKKKFAAKILNPDTARRPDSLARFQQEAVSASRLDHENIVNVVNFGASDDGTVYLIMEFLKGETLNQVLSKGPLPLDDVLRVAVPMCRGLAAAHNAGIVHRDMKPENVFVARRSGGRHIIKLLDFGVSKIKESHFAERRITQTGDVLGSPLYMSPEASKGEGDVDGRADIYAVGVMLYEMSTGAVPFTADNYLQVLYKHIQEPAPSPRALRPDLPEALEAVIGRALAKEPAARFQRMEELEAALIAARPAVDLDAPISQAAPFTQVSIDAPVSQPMPVVAPPRRTPAPFVGPILTPAPEPVAPRARSSVGMIAGFVGTLAALALAAVLVLRPRQAHAPTPAPPPPAPRVAPAPEPLAVAAPAPAPRAELSIDSDPQGAAVTLDGQPVGATPLTTLVDADAREHTVRLELAGYRPETRLVVVDRSRALAVALRRAPGRPRPMDIKEGR